MTMSLCRRIKELDFVLSQFTYEAVQDKPAAGPVTDARSAINRASLLVTLNDRPTRRPHP